MIKVYHAKDFLTNYFGDFDPDISGLIPVAEVDTDDLEDAYTRTNHIDHDWSRNGGVRALSIGPHRSTSCGDLLIHNSKAFVVEGAGFREVSKNYYASLQSNSIL